MALTKDQLIAHEVGLIDSGKAQADPVGTLVKPERHRHRNGTA